MAINTDPFFARGAAAPAAGPGPAPAAAPVPAAAREPLLRTVLFAGPRLAARAGNGLRDMAAAPIVGTGSSLVRGATHELDQYLQSPAAQQNGREFLHELLSAEMAPELVELGTTLADISRHPERLTRAQIQTVTGRLNWLLGRDEATFIRWRLPDGVRPLEILRPELEQLRDLFADFDARLQAAHANEPALLTEFRAAINHEPHSVRLGTSAAVMARFLTAKQGALVQGVLFLQRALISGDDGLIGQVMETFQQQIAQRGPIAVRDLLERATAELRANIQNPQGILGSLYDGLMHEQTGVLTRAIDFLRTVLLGNQNDPGLLKRLELESIAAVGRLSTALNEENGPISQTKHNINESIASIVAQAREQFLGNAGVLSELETRLMGRLCAEGFIPAFLGRLDESVSNAATKIGAAAPALTELVDEVNTAIPRLGKLVEQLDKVIKQAGTSSPAVTELIEEVNTAIPRLSQLVNQTGAALEKVIKQAGTSSPALTDLVDEVSTAIPKLSEFVKQANKLVKQAGSASPALADLVEEVGTATSKLGELVKQANKLVKQVGTAAPKIGKVIEQAGTAAPAFTVLAEKVGDAATKVGDAAAKIDQAVSGLNGLVDKAGQLLDNGKKAFGLGGSDDENLFEERPKSESSTTAGSWLDKMGQKIKSFIGKGVSALSHQALAQFASVLAYGIEKILDQIKKNPQLGAHKASLQAMLEKVEALKQTPDFEALKGIAGDLEKVAKLFNATNIYLGQFMLPKLGGSGADDDSESEFLTNIDKLRDVSDEPKANGATGSDWQKLANDEKDKFIRNTTSFLTVRFIYNNICNLPPDNDHYIRMMNQTGHLGKDLSTLVYEDLKSKGFSWGALKVASIFFAIANYFIDGFIKRASNALLKDVLDYINAQRDDQFQNFSETRIQDALGYLTLLGDSYVHIAQDSRNTSDTRCATGPIDQMLQREMERSKRNDNQTVKQIHAQFARNIIRKGSANRLMAWILEKMIPQATLVENIVSSSVSFVRDANGYPHALNSAIYELLEEVWNAMKTPDVVEQDPASSHLFSTARKQQLSALVKNLFNVLQYAKCDTFEELRALVDGTSVMGNIEKVVDSVFINDIVERTTLMLCTVLYSLAKKDELSKMTYKLLQVANNAYDANAQTASPQQAKEKEMQVHELSSRILKKSIKDAVNAKFKGPKEHEQEQVNKAIETLKTSTEALIAQTHKDLEALDGMADLDSLAARTKTEALRAQLHHFENACADARIKIQAKPWDENNKKELEKRYRELDKARQPLLDAIVAIKTHMNVLEHHERFSRHLKQMHVDIVKLNAYLASDASADTIEQGLALVKELNDHLKVLEALSPASPSVQKLNEADEITKVIPLFRKKINECEAKLVVMQNAQATMDLCDMLTSAASPLEKILSGNLPLKDKTAQIFALRQALQKYIPLPKRRAYMDAFEDLVHAPTKEKKEAFISMLRKISGEAQEIIAGHKAHISGEMQAFQSGIPGMEVLQSDYTKNKKDQVKALLAQAKTGLKAFEETYESHLQSVPYIAIPFKLDWFNDWAAHTVYTRTKERTDGILRLVSSQVIPPSLLNHTVFMPYNKHRGLDSPSLARRATRWLAEVF